MNKSRTRQSQVPMLRPVMGPIRLAADPSILVRVALVNGEHVLKYCEAGSTFHWNMEQATVIKEALDDAITTYCYRCAGSDYFEPSREGDIAIFYEPDDMPYCIRLDMVDTNGIGRRLWMHTATAQTLTHAIASGIFELVKWKFPLS